MLGRSWPSTDDRKGNDMSYTEKAEAALEKAEEWANRDGVVDQKFRMDMVERNLIHAQVYATLAVADRIDWIIGLVFDDARAIHVRDADAVGL